MMKRSAWLAEAQATDSAVRTIEFGLSCLPYEIAFQFKTYVGRAMRKKQAGKDSAVTIAIIGAVTTIIVALIGLLARQPPATPGTLIPATPPVAGVAPTMLLSATPVQIVVTSTPSAKEHYDRGEANFRNAEYDLAIAEFTAAIDQGYDPLSKAYDFRGWAYYKRGKAENNQDQIDATKFAKAKQDFGQALLLTAGDPTGVISTTGYYDAYQGLGWVYYREAQQGKDKSLYEIALRYFLAALNLANDNRNADMLLGASWSYYKLEEYENAINYFRQVLAVDDSYADAYDGLGWSYYRQQNYKDAIASFRKALEIDKGLSDAQDGLQHAQQDSGQSSPNN
jgi:tetratricopeptide (TPR) repeat protein